MRIFVKGVPEAQARPRMGRGTVYSPKTAWWWAVCSQAQLKHPPKPMLGPLRLRAVFRFPRPKSVPAKVFWKATRPDADNLIKAVMDAVMASGRWFADDGQIVDVDAMKVYAAAGQEAGAVIDIYEIIESVAL